MYGVGVYRYEQRFPTIPATPSANYRMTPPGLGGCTACGYAGDSWQYTMSKYALPISIGTGVIVGRVLTRSAVLGVVAGAVAGLFCFFSGVPRN